MCVSVGSRGTRQELTKSKKCRSSRLQGYSLRPRTRALRLTRRAMASAEGEWAEFLLMVDDLAFMNGMAS